MSGVTVVDSDAVSAGKTLSVILSDSLGLLTANTSASGGGGTITGSGSKQMTITGSLSKVNADLTTLSDLTSTTSADTITVATYDGRGGASQKQIAATVNIPPTLTAPAAFSALPQTTVPIASVDVSDSDAVNAGKTITVALVDTSGLLFANTSASGGGGTITGAGTLDLTIAGALAQVDADLSTLSYQSGVSGADTIQLTASDSRGGSNQQQIAVTINVPPKITLPASQFARLNVATSVTGLSIADADASSLGKIITVTLDDGYGLLSANTTASGGGGTIIGSGTTDLSISGSLAQVNADLSTLGYQSATSAADTISIAANDGRGGAAYQQLSMTVGADYTLTTSADTINGVAGDNTIIAATKTLSAGDVINGGPDANVLQLTGGGVFDLKLPKTLIDVQTLDAQEGAGAAKQTITLRNGLNLTVNVASGGAGTGISITGAADASVITRIGRGHRGRRRGPRNDQRRWRRRCDRGDRRHDRRDDQRRRGRQ